MSAISALNPGMAGIYKGMQQLEQAAARIASTENTVSANPADLTEPLLALKAAEIQVAASAKAVAAVDETLGRFIDEMA